MTRAIGPAAARLYRWHVARPRLARAIEESAARVVLLVAPAGYGKTTAAREWIAGKRSGWYRPTAASSDVAAFAAELGRTAQPIVPGAGERLAVRLSHGNPDTAAAAELLAADLADWPADAWLVVDDYHLADSPAVAELVDRLLELTPVRLVVATRSRPTWATARREVHGGLVVLTGDRLAMTPAEAAQVLGGREREAPQELVARAAGWPALIGLAAIAESTELPQGRMAQALYRYLAAEVLEQRPPAEQRVMLRASVPFEVDADAVRGALELPGSEELLEALAADGILHPSAADAYRFHPLLRDFLRSRLRSEDGVLFRRLAAGLAAAARADARWEEGIELALDAGDVEEAAAIVGESCPALFARGRVETVERWAARCASATGDAAFALARAEVAMRRGRVTEARTSLAGLSRTLDDGHPCTARVWRGLAYADEHFTHYEQALGAALRAVDVARGDQERLDSLYLAAKMASECRPDLLPGLMEGLEALPPTPEALATLAAVRLFVGIHGCDLSGLEELYDDGLRARASVDPFVRRRLFVGADYLALSRGDYRRSREIARAGAAFAVEVHFSGVVVALRYVELANACIGLRELRAAERALGQAERVASPEVRWLAWEHGNSAAKLQLARGELEAVADGGPPDPAAGIPVHRVAERAGLRAIAAAALGRHAQALDEIARAAGAGQGIEGHFYSRFAGAILDGSRVPGVVADAFRSAFHDACVIAYRAHPPLLAAAAAERALRPELTRLVLAANDRALGRAAGLLPAAEREEADASALTRREAEVLALLADGLSDREIAERLYIARSTAKLHVHHILEKLGVSSRTQAALAAQREHA